MNEELGLLAEPDEAAVNEILYTAERMGLLKVWQDASGTAYRLTGSGLAWAIVFRSLSTDTREQDPSRG